MTVMKGKEIDWVDNLFKQLQRKLMRWTTFQTKMMMGTVEVNPKKHVYHLVLIIEILMQHFFPNTNQQSPLEAAPIGMHDASTSWVNTS
jgi:hypothetical protein